MSQARTLAFVLRATRKLLRGLEQGSQSGSHFRRTSHQVIGEREGRSRAREQGGVNYKHLNRGDGGVDRWRLWRWIRTG